MSRANFCAECGARLQRKGWRHWLYARLCGQCAGRLGTVASFRGLLSVLLVAAAAYSLGRYVRPSPPPLIIQRLPNSPLSDTPVDPNHLVQSNGNSSARSEPNPNQPNSEEEVYICGARTQKGKPCRRRVHTLGDRCFQHKGLPAMVSLEKLVIKPGK